MSREFFGASFWSKVLVSALSQMPLIAFWFWIGMRYERIAAAEAKVRMQTIPCAKGVACREIVVDTAWMQVVDVANVAGIDTIPCAIGSGCTSARLSPDRNEVVLVLIGNRPLEVRGIEGSCVVNSSLVRSYESDLKKCKGAM